MSVIIIDLAQFPDAIPGDVQNGDVISLLVRGQVKRQEDDLIDTTALGSAPSWVLGGREVELALLEVTPQ